MITVNLIRTVLFHRTFVVIVNYYNCVLKWLQRNCTKIGFNSLSTVDDHDS